MYKSPKKQLLLQSINESVENDMFKRKCIEVKLVKEMNENPITKC